MQSARESPPDREYYFSDANFAFIQKLAYEATGIKLSEHKRNMVYGRLARRLRKLKLDCFDDYCRLIDDNGSAEFSEFINAITTNLTSFFRENYHFDFLRTTALPQALDHNRTSKRIRGWSAGCSTGEEPYSIAITVMETIKTERWDVKLLATDLDSNVVAKAMAGVYTCDRVEKIPDSIKTKYFCRNKSGDSVAVKPTLKQLITFKQLNLLHPWPVKGPFDFIFCRNVVIYFDRDTQRVLFDRFADLIRPGGYLFIGHSENLHRGSSRFKSLGKTIYQRLD